MKKTLVFLSLTLSLAIHAEHSQKNTMKLEYPVTKSVERSDVFFGTKISDPYRWLEDDHAKETKKWVKEQNALTSTYLSQIDL